MKVGFTKILWGTLLLLAAAFIVANQVNEFATVGVWGIIVALLAVAFIVQCLVRGSFAPLPLPLAMLYLIFCETLNLPQIGTWPLIFAAILSWIGLGILLPRKRWYHFMWTSGDAKRYRSKTCYTSDMAKEVHTTYSSGESNPVITVNFGAVSKHIQTDNLESMQLNCNFGAIEVDLSGAQVCSRGAVADMNCSFGAISLQIPKTWNVIDKLDCTLGGVEFGKRDVMPSENAPTITLKGTVSLGGVELKFI